MKRTRYEITYSKKLKLWTVKTKEFSQSFVRKSDAIRFAIDMARFDRPSQLVIHKKDGKIQEELTYGNDPYPPKG